MVNNLYRCDKCGHERLVDSEVYGYSQDGYACPIKVVPNSLTGWCLGVLWPVQSLESTTKREG